MDYKLPFPSLKHITMVHIGSNCFNRILTANFKECKRQMLPEVFSSWSVLKNKVSGILDSLPLPGILRAKESDLWDIIRQLYLQIRDCYMMHLLRDRLLPFPTVYRFCFNVYGEIRMKEMFEIYMENTFINSNFHDITLGFQLACELCLEDSVSDIWKRMNARDRTKVYKMGKNNAWLTYWINKVQKRTRPSKRNSFVVYPTCSAYENLMHFVMVPNAFPAEYVWCKLTYAEKVNKSAFYARMVLLFSHGNLLVRLLMSLTKEQQMEILRSNIDSVLICLLQFPYDKFFLPTLELIQHAMSKSCFMSVLEGITYRMQGCPCNRYRYIFSEFWSRTSYELKNSIMNSGSNKHLQRVINSVKRIDPDTCEVIYKDIKAVGGLVYNFRLSSPSSRCAVRVTKCDVSKPQAKKSKFC